MYLFPITPSNVCPAHQRLSWTCIAHMLIHTLLRFKEEQGRKQDELWANAHLWYPPLFGKQEVGIWRVKKRFPRYGVPIWSLWPNIRFLPSIVAEKNEHICSMCIKTNKVGKQELGIWWVQKRYPQYGIPMRRLWPKIRFLPSTVTEKNAEGRTEVKQYTPLPLWGAGI